VDDIRVIRALLIDADLSRGQLDRLRTEVFTNPVTEESGYASMARDFDWLGLGGIPPWGARYRRKHCKEAIEDLLHVRFRDGEDIYTSKLYEMRGI